MSYLQTPPTPSWETVVDRHPGNPILQPRDMPVPCVGVYNSGVVKTPAGKYIMASRFERPNKKHHIWISRSDDGIAFTPDPEPMRIELGNPPDGCTQEEYDDATIMSAPGLGTWYDPRINELEGDYYLTYAAVNNLGCRVAIAKVVDDFKTAQHISFPHHIVNRNAVLFPEKIDGKYRMLHRPLNMKNSGSIWISDSPDLVYWGRCRPIAHPQAYFENKKIGPAAPPVKTSEGWLIIYHAVFGHCNGFNYSGGAMLLDLNDPTKVIARAKDPILWVETDYEMIGQVPNVIFPGSAIVEDDGSVKLYYGGADYVQCLAHTSIDRLLDACHNK